MVAILGVVFLGRKALGRELARYFAEVAGGAILVALP